MNMSYNKVTLCKSSGLVEYGSICAAKSFKVNASFNEDSLTSRSCNTAAERKRNRNYKSTRAAYYKEHEGTVNPGAPGCLPVSVAALKADNKAWNDSQCQCRVNNDWCINVGKAGNKLL